MQSQPSSPRDRALARATSNNSVLDQSLSTGNSSRPEEKGRDHTTIVLRETGKEYNVDTELLGYASAFFKAAVSSRWMKSNEKVMELSLTENMWHTVLAWLNEVAATIFAIPEETRTPVTISRVLWKDKSIARQIRFLPDLYLLEQSPASSMYAKSTGICFRDRCYFLDFLVDTWITADFLRIPDLMNSTLDKIISVLREMEHLHHAIPLYDLRYIELSTVPEAPLRHVFLDSIQACLPRHVIQATVESGAMSQDIHTEMLARKDIAWGEAPWNRPICPYHEHPETSCSWGYDCTSTWFEMSPLEWNVYCESLETKVCLVNTQDSVIGSSIDYDTYSW